MNVTMATAQKISRLIKKEASLDSFSSVEMLSSEITRLEKLREQAQRLNEHAFEDARARAELVAPGLIATNAMFSRNMIDEELEGLREQSQVIGADTLGVISQRILVLRIERGRRNCLARKSLKALN